MTYAMPTLLSSTTSPSSLCVARWKDSINTWTKEAIMATEKMSCAGVSRCCCPHVVAYSRKQTDHAEGFKAPLACRILRPVSQRIVADACPDADAKRGRTLCLSVCTPIAQLVPRMMKVLNKSSAESTSEAVSDIEAE